MLLKQKKPEKFRPEWESNPVLCDASAVLDQLSYQAIWELVVRWVHDNPVYGGNYDVDENRKLMLFFVATCTVNVATYTACVNNTC